uniref:Uncharacterized protein n=1 Tax=Sphaerodactylus townsendi TaxID=933632 RepID=A0ACB8FA52_9SAUR
MTVHFHDIEPGDWVVTHVPELENWTVHASVRTKDPVKDLQFLLFKLSASYSSCSWKVLRSSISKVSFRLDDHGKAIEEITDRIKKHPAHVSSPLDCVQDNGLGDSLF